MYYKLLYLFMRFCVQSTQVQVDQVGCYWRSYVNPVLLLAFLFHLKENPTPYDVVREKIWPILYTLCP